jgi:hypothetical protein
VGVLSVCEDFLHVSSTDPLIVGCRQDGECEPMSGDTEDRLFGLMEIAQGHQTAVQAALDGLAAERVALRKERETLAWEVRALERSMDTAVREAVKASLAGAATEGAAAVQAATQPLLGRLADETEIMRSRLESRS